MSVPEDALHKRGRVLEDLFFAERDRQLMETLKRRVTAEEAERVLAAATGVQEEIAIRELSSLSAPHFLAVLGIFPLVAVAWCDREVAAAERKAILAAMHEMGAEAGSPSHQLLDRWLETRPADNAEELWRDYTRAVCQTLDPETVAKLKKSVMGRARKIALAAGGILGIGYKISTEEQACLDRLSAAFEPAAQ
jgi:hypothetical protein